MSIISTSPLNLYTLTDVTLGGNMSIYATLNSAKAIPMEIRDSTVRFQTFGQRDNYDAPPIPIPNYKKNRRKSAPNSSPPEAMALGKRYRKIILRCLEMPEVIATMSNTLILMIRKTVCIPIMHAHIN
jgi:hypothetical protein